MQQAGVDMIASAASFSEPTIAQILDQVQTGSTSGYAVMPLHNGSMVPLCPLQPFSNDCISSVSSGAMPCDAITLITGNPDFARTLHPHASAQHATEYHGPVTRSADATCSVVVQGRNRVLPVWRENQETWAFRVEPPDSRKQSASLFHRRSIGSKLGSFDATVYSQVSCTAPNAGLRSPHDQAACQQNPEAGAADHLARRFARGYEAQTQWKRTWQSSGRQRHQSSRIAVVDKAVLRPDEV